MNAKRNYQKELDRLIAGLNGRRPSLLLHACCAPCSSYVLEYLSRYFQITLFYYNPNIAPESEYQYRVSELRRLVTEMLPDAGITVLEAPMIRSALPRRCGDWRERRREARAAGCASGSGWRRRPKWPGNWGVITLPQPSPSVP